MFGVPALAGLFMFGVPALAGPFLFGVPALAGPFLFGVPALAGLFLFGVPALAGPFLFGVPALAGQGETRKLPPNGGTPSHHFPFLTPRVLKRKVFVSAPVLRFSSI